MHVDSGCRVWNLAIELLGRYFNNGITSVPSVTVVLSSTMLSL